MRGVLLPSVHFLAGLVSCAAFAGFSTPNVPLASHSASDHFDLPSNGVPTVCHGQADNPHYSDGSGGIIFKMRASCSVTTSVSSISGRLWKCANLPSGNEDSWTGQGCAIMASHDYSDQVVQQGTTGTWYVPPTGQPGVHGAGQWVGVASFSENGNTTKVRSNAVYIDR